MTIPPHTLLPSEQEDEQPFEEPFLFFSEDVPDPIQNPQQITQWLHHIVNSEQGNLDQVNFIFCSDQYLLNINIEYLQHDYYTDIITFQHTKKIVGGDIFISTDRVADNAQTLQIPFLDELHRVIAHGILHMLGYKDKTKKDKQLMTQKEDHYLLQRTQCFT